MIDFLLGELDVQVEVVPQDNTLLSSVCTAWCNTIPVAPMSLHWSKALRSNMDYMQ